MSAGFQIWIYSPYIGPAMVTPNWYLQTFRRAHIRIIIRKKIVLGWEIILKTFPSQPFHTYISRYASSCSSCVVNSRETLVPVWRLLILFKETKQKTKQKPEEEIPAFFPPIQLYNGDTLWQILYLIIFLVPAAQLWLSLLRFLGFCYQPPGWHR